MLIVLTIVGLVLLALAGCNYAWPRFQPGWFGLLALALVSAWPLLSRL